VTRFNWLMRILILVHVLCARASTCSTDAFENQRKLCQGIQNNEKLMSICREVRQEWRIECLKGKNTILDVSQSRGFVTGYAKGAKETAIETWQFVKTSWEFLGNKASAYWKSFSANPYLKKPPIKSDIHLPPEKAQNKDGAWEININSDALRIFAGQITREDLAKVYFAAQEILPEFISGWPCMRQEAQMEAIGLFVAKMTFPPAALLEFLKLATAGLRGAQLIKKLGFYEKQFSEAVAEIKSAMRSAEIAEARPNFAAATEVSTVKTPVISAKKFKPLAGSNAKVPVSDALQNLDRETLLKLSKEKTLEIKNDLKNMGIDSALEIAPEKDRYRVKILRSSQNDQKLSKITDGIWENYDTDLYLDPFDLRRRNIGGLFEESIENGKEIKLMHTPQEIEETIYHEVMHAHFRNELAKGNFGVYHARVVNNSRSTDLPIVPSFYSKKGYELEEVMTYKRDLTSRDRQFIKLLQNPQMSEEEKRSIAFQWSQETIRRADNVSRFAEGFLKVSSEMDTSQVNFSSETMSAIVKTPGDKKKIPQSNEILFFKYVSKDGTQEIQIPFQGKSGSKQRVNLKNAYREALEERNQFARETVNEMSDRVTVGRLIQKNPDRAREIFEGFDHVQRKVGYLEADNALARVKRAHTGAFPYKSARSAVLDLLPNSEVTIVTHYGEKARQYYSKEKRAGFIIWTNPYVRMNGDKQNLDTQFLLEFITTPK